MLTCMSMLLPLPPFIAYILLFLCTQFVLNFRTRAVDRQTIRVVIPYSVCVTIPLTVLPLVSFRTVGTAVVIEALRHAAGAEASQTQQKTNSLRAFGGWTMCTTQHSVMQ